MEELADADDKSKREYKIGEGFPSVKYGRNYFKTRTLLKYWNLGSQCGTFRV